MAVTIPEVMIDVIIAEALGEGDAGMAQVAQVMFNRSNQRGKSLQSIVTANKQFTAYLKPGREVKKSMKNPDVRARVKKLIEGVENGDIAVPFPDADHYHTKKVDPKWNDNMPFDGNLGAHQFYTSRPMKKYVAKHGSRSGVASQQAEAVPVEGGPPVRPDNVKTAANDPIGDLITANSYAPQAEKAVVQSDALDAINERIPQTVPATASLQNKAVLDGQNGVVEPSGVKSRSPFTPGGRENFAQDNCTELAAVDYSPLDNKGIDRNLLPAQHLENQILQSVTDVYGPGYTVSVISGRQEEGVSNGVVGSRRHNIAAADVYVYDANGKVLRGDALLPVAQEWLASDRGSVGFPARDGQSLHLDLGGGNVEGSFELDPSQETRLWYYGEPTASQRSLLNSSLKNKTMPTVMAKNAPRPPEFGAAETARLAFNSTLNTPEQSSQAAIAAGFPARKLRTKAGEVYDILDTKQAYAGQPNPIAAATPRQEVASGIQSASYNRSPMLQQELDQAAQNFNAGSEVQTASYNRSPMLQEELDIAASQYKGAQQQTNARPTKELERDDPNTSNEPRSASYNRSPMLQRELDQAASGIQPKAPEYKRPAKALEREDANITTSVRSEPKNPTAPKYIERELQQAQEDARDPSSALSQQMAKYGVSRPTNAAAPAQKTERILNPVWKKQNQRYNALKNKKGGYAEVQQEASGVKRKEVLSDQSGVGRDLGARVSNNVQGGLDRLQQVGTNIQSLVTDPGNYLQNKVSGIGERVKSKLQPVADFLEGPDYSKHSTEVRTGHTQENNTTSNVMAVNSKGGTKVNITRGDSDRTRDDKEGSLGNDVYRANKEVFQKHGMLMTASNAKKLIEKGETLYKRA